MFERSQVCASVCASERGGGETEVEVERDGTF